MHFWSLFSEESKQAIKKDGGWVGEGKKKEASGFTLSSPDTR